MDSSQISLSVVLWAILGLSLVSCQFAPGVPPREVPTNGENIKFHDPSEFRSQAQPQQPQGQNQGQNQALPSQKPPLHQNRGQEPQQVRHHAHMAGKTHGVKIAFPDEDAQKAREHMKVHNQEKFVNVDELSQPQLIMQHFRNFDLDKNGKIDGLEILKAAIIMNAEHEEDDDSLSQMNFLEMAHEADETLKTYDENNDGFIHYGEFYRTHKQILNKGA